MKTGCLLFLVMLMSAFSHAQTRCGGADYLQKRLSADASLAGKIQSIEQVQQQQALTSRTEGTVIKIPVVVHVLYHLPSEKISDALIQSQIAALNTCFRHKNADSVNTPSYFRSLAADCEIEFQLAYSDPRRRSTSGIVRKYTPISYWEADDKVKFSASMGDDAWDPKSYLNIWVCNLKDVAGYSSVIGDSLSKDGIVIGFNAFGVTNSGNHFDLGKTAVHEAGHWLNLKHIWGDTYCGDDGVSDTPKQAGYNVGCPSGVRTTCGNGTNGDMYMDYMDFTNDACMNMFTQGQKTRMQQLFAPGGYRNSMLSSKGLQYPLIMDAALPDSDPQWLHPNLYPNPTSGQVTIDLAYDSRWIGNTIQVYNLQGQIMTTLTISAKIHQYDLSSLKPGVYFLTARKADGETWKQKFVRL